MAIFQETDGVKGVNRTEKADGAQHADAIQKSAVLHRDLRHNFLELSKGEGHYLVLNDGRRIFDASGGAAVACHGNDKVNQAMVDQISKVSYCASAFFKTPIVEEAARILVDSTDGNMTRVYFVQSGSEAMEAAMKLARQYYLEKEMPEPQRVRFIAREQSYHGTTLGSLAMGGHVARRAKFEPILMNNISKVSPCFSYRGKVKNETDEQYVQRLAAELDSEFQRVDPKTVCAFVAEPVVGAALGCVPAVPGYFRAVQAVCRKYGALLILDEVMSGMGRTGSYHAWQQEGIIPDIQTLGKGLGGGYQPVAAVLIHKDIVETLQKGTAAFMHGHTYQAHAVGCAAAVAVQKIIQEDNLIMNVRTMGQLLERRLNESIGGHPNVGNIRGRGLFWAVEFVEDKLTKAPFSASERVAANLNNLGLTAPYSIVVYPGSGTADGLSGDHIILAPPYTVTAVEVEDLVQTFKSLVEDFFAARSVSSGHSG
ncbi:PLP-dependent transferase [Cryphonectria parasitica EP155]|uniref:PLP-dependent transferase n=1 Tax=Cryphonectria parasitica (strain ATCC 38755 / EP155) TaxID=660469 RepID=A0A9P5CQC4_CRYP1|nr:PLP-dependent transferase [Cryphonectria parasitica EP155]KAF3767374.1 PLP-dependent transferase [Cryphonectria parasitica EP155]